MRLLIYCIPPFLFSVDRLCPKPQTRWEAHEYRTADLNDEELEGFFTSVPSHVLGIVSMQGCFVINSSLTFECHWQMGTLFLVHYTSSCVREGWFTAEIHFDSESLQGMVRFLLASTPWPYTSSRGLVKHRKITLTGRYRPFLTVYYRPFQVLGLFGCKQTRWKSLLTPTASPTTNTIRIGQATWLAWISGINIKASIIRYAYSRRREKKSTFFFFFFDA